MLIKAKRGVCVGVDRHLKPGDTADLEPATVQFLVGIGAVEPVKDEPKASKPEPEAEHEPESEPDSEPDPFGDDDHTLHSKHKRPSKGGKEK